jgi:hypothetical protein
MPPNELRYILLHELAHLHRHDILVSVIASGLQILHWFNPLVSYGLVRMRADRELACDGLALSLLHPHEASAYGRTVIRLIEQLIRPRPRLLLAGFLGDRARIKERVAMISLFRKETYQWSPLALVLVVLVGCIGLTNGRAGDPRAEAQPAAVQPSERHEAPEALATAHGFSNTMRIYIRHHQMDKYLVANGRSVASADEPGETGFWEARFNGEFTPDGPMLIYSIAQGMYLGIDDQGNLTVNQRTPDKWAHWYRKAGPLGVQLISQALEHGYLRLEEEGRVNVVQMGRDLPSQWDVMQLGRGTEKEQK